MRVTIRVKLLASMVSVIALLGVASYMQVKGLTAVVQNYGDLLRAEKIVSSGEGMRSSLRDEYSAATGFLSSKDASQKQSFLDAKKEVDGDLAQLQKLLTAKGDQTALAGIAKEVQALSDQGQAVFDMKEITSAQSSDVKKSLRDIRDKASDEAQTLINRVSSADDAVREARQKTAEIAAAGTRTMTLLVTALTMLAGLALLIWLVRSVTRPLALLQAQLRELAAGRGDLTQNLAVSSRDEIGDLSESFNAFLAMLRDLLRQVTDSSSMLATSSGQLTATTGNVTRAAAGVAEAAGQVARGAEEQSRSAQEAARHVEHLRTAIAQIASGAQEQSDSMNRTAGAVSEVVSSIDNVAGRARDVLGAF